MIRLLPTLGIICLLAVPSFSQTQTEEPVISAERAAARKELGLLGLQYSKDSLVKQAYEGDTIAVRLFLAAGMDPMSVTKMATLPSAQQHPTATLRPSSFCWPAEPTSTTETAKTIPRSFRPPPLAALRW